MGFFHREKTECDECHIRLGSYDELVQHSKDTHKLRPFKCGSCGKEFLHEKERLHHVKEEKEKKIDARRHRF